MPILLKRKNGEITPFRNAEYISAFYFIPKSILDKCGEEINSIPRNPRKLLQDRRAIEIIESDLFKLVIIDAYAFMVWPFMGLSAKREIYSGYEPSWTCRYRGQGPHLFKCQGRCDAAVWLPYEGCASGFPAADQRQWYRTERRTWDPFCPDAG